MAPKCGVCVAVYLGLGTGFGLVGPGICGGTAGWSWFDWLAAVGAAAGGIRLITREQRPH